MKLLLEYLALCFFINNPNDLEPSKAFVWRCIAFYLVSGIIVEANISDPADATLEVAARALMAVSLISVLLLALKKWPQYSQLLTAIFICENLIMTIGIGVEVLDVVLHKTEYKDVPLYLGGILIVWYLMIVAYILRQMFSFKTWVSLVWAFFYFTLTYGLPFLFMEVI
ncbi:MAG: hypothetical protein NTV00_15090 [Methylococcales bacterium]|nr:hypothetical protein [Methylococcales bacterium]